MEAKNKFAKPTFALIGKLLHIEAISYARLTSHLLWCVLSTGCRYRFSQYSSYIGKDLYYRTERPSSYHSVNGCYYCILRIWDHIQKLRKYNCSRYNSILLSRLYIRSVPYHAARRKYQPWHSMEPRWTPRLRNPGTLMILRHSLGQFS